MKIPKLKSIFLTIAMVACLSSLAFAVTELSPLKIELETFSAEDTGVSSALTIRNLTERSITIHDYSLTVSFGAIPATPGTRLNTNIPEGLRVPAMGVIVLGQDVLQYHVFGGFGVLISPVVTAKVHIEYSTVESVNSDGDVTLVGHVIDTVVEQPLNMEAEAIVSQIQLVNSNVTSTQAAVENVGSAVKDAHQKLESHLTKQDTVLSNIYKYVKATNGFVTQINYFVVKIYNLLSSHVGGSSTSTGGTLTLHSTNP